MRQYLQSAVFNQIVLGANGHKQICSGFRLYFKIFAWRLLCIQILNIKVLISMFVYILSYELRAYIKEHHLLADGEDKDYYKTLNENLLLIYI